LARVLKRGPCEIKGNCAKYPSAVCKEIADELSKCVMLANHLRKVYNKRILCVSKKERKRILPPLNNHHPSDGGSAYTPIATVYEACLPSFFVYHFVFCNFVNITRSTSC